MEKTGKKTTVAPSAMSSLFSIPAIVWTILGSLMSLLIALGAGKLSYDKYGSYAWALVATVFAPVYYPYYAYFVSTSSVTTMFGGKRRR